MGSLEYINEDRQECNQRIVELNKIANEIRNCQRCRLGLTRTLAVPGEGNPCSGIVFIGEAPGRNEDLEGKPFVGAAGKLLTDLMHSIGLDRGEVFITNIVKCRPPNNRDPSLDEITTCSYYLERQLKILKPKIIITLGRHSSKYLLERFGKRFSSIMRIRGKVFLIKTGWGETYLIPTLHPAAALYNPSFKQFLEKDFILIKKYIKLKQGKRGLELFF